MYSAPATLPANSLAYQGEWTLRPEYAAPKQNARLLVRFDAKDVFLVARRKDGVAGTMKVYLDGSPITGADVVDGEVIVDSDSLYHLLTLPSAGEHELTIEFPDERLEVYAFTFG